MMNRLLVRLGEVLAIVIGTGLAGYLFLDVWQAEKPDVGLSAAGTIVGAALKAETPAPRRVLQSSQSRAGISRYPQAVVSEEEHSGGGSDIAMRDIGERLSPDDPVMSVSSEVVNIGRFIDPDDDNTWLPVENPPTRDIGEFLDPDRAY